MFRNVVCHDLVTTVRRLSRNILDETKAAPVNNCKDCPFRHGPFGHFRGKKLKKRARLPAERPPVNRKEVDQVSKVHCCHELT